MLNAPDVSLLITHYNRSASLERLLTSLRGLQCNFAEVIVSDDGSKPEHRARLEELRDEHGLTLVSTEVNRGLGNNLNKGQDAVKTPFVIYVQEDFCPTSAFPQRFANALLMMKERDDLDVVRFFWQRRYPLLKPYKNGFSEMAFKLVHPGSQKYFCYSDTPHLRRSNFFQRFGRYAEGIPAIKTEKSMVMSFLQSRGKAIICDRSDSFIHENSLQEPSTQDYSGFFRIKSKFPEPVFDAIWTAKLTGELLFKRYRQ